MAANVVKLKPETYERVRAKAREQGVTMQDIITRGIDALDHLEFAQAFKRDYKRAFGKFEEFVTHFAPLPARGLETV
jgi:hypothetical protein